MDDINYLKQHADEESFLFVVDSSRRDTATFPLPHEYEVHFNSPFRNVVGLDLIDATVPRTEYLVESHSNTLVYTHNDTRYTVRAPPGDYNILQLTSTMNERLSPRLRMEVTTAPAEVSNQIRFVSDAPFVVHTAESSMRTALGLGVATLASAPAPGILGTQTIVTGPLPSVSSVPMHTPVRQAFVAPHTGTLTRLDVYVRSNEVAPLQVAIISGSTVVAQTNAHTTGTDFEQLTIPLRAPIQAGNQYYLVLASPAAAVFCEGPDVGVAQGGASLNQQWWNYAAWSGGSETLCLDLTMDVDGHQLQPPGVVNLTGEPFVLIRCPEVEQQLYRDRAFETVHAGLGLVKLANYGFREQRFDFTSFPPRKLPTPIGKLGKLTIRLERGDGSPYDTKGVNHHLVLVIRYMEMTKGPESMQSVLNPQYLPNPLHYLQKY